LLAVADGQAKITVTTGSLTKEVPVTVSGVLAQPAVGFTEHIRPILNKTGCAMAACHASQHGKGGFKLSVFGSEPIQDWTAMARDSVQRRTDFVLPENSLVILKPTMGVPHGGGKRIEKGSVEYQTMLAWVKAHAQTAAQIEVTKPTYPSRRVGQTGLKQQIRVEAEYAGGKRKDVTALARFDSMDDGVLSVNRDGLVTTVGKGQGALMVRFEGQAEIAQFVVPYADKVELAGWQNHNFVDELAAAKFRELGIEPSPLCDDSTFIRRTYEDALGTLPTPEETLAFPPGRNWPTVDRQLAQRARITTTTSTPPTGPSSGPISSATAAANWGTRGCGRCTTGSRNRSARTRVLTSSSAS
jgi:hypothetical protein